MFDHDYERSSSDDDVDRNDYKQDDAQEEDEDAYLESTGKTQVAMITESLMITNTDLYSFAEEFMELIENQTFLWPVAYAQGHQVPERQVNRVQQGGCPREEHRIAQLPTAL